jgi:hypothetical protein
MATDGTLISSCGKFLHHHTVMLCAAPLSICTKEEQRAMICFLWSEGVPEAEIHRRLSAQYGGNAHQREQEQSCGHLSTPTGPLC